MDIKKLLATLDKLPEYLSGDHSDIMEGAKNIIGAWGELDIFFQRLGRLRKMEAEGVPITDDDDITLVNIWDECKPDIDKCIRRMYSRQEIPEITDPAELPEYLSDGDLFVVEMAATRLEQLMDVSNAR